MANHILLCAEMPVMGGPVPARLFHNFFHGDFVDSLVLQKQQQALHDAPGQVGRGSRLIHEIDTSIAWTPECSPRVLPGRVSPCLRKLYYISREKTSRENRLPTPVSPGPGRRPGSSRENSAICTKCDCNKSGLLSLVFPPFFDYY